MNEALTAGCPSGLAPPELGGAAGADPSAFVHRGKDGLDHLEILVRGARCANCMRKIEHGLLEMPGVSAARLNLSTGRLSLAWRPGAAEPRSLVTRVFDLGYGAAPFDPAEAKAEQDREGRSLLIALAVAGFAMMNIMMFSVPVWAGAGEMGTSTREALHWVSALIAVPAALFAGRPFFRSAAAALAKRQANMDVPISLGVILTLAMSLFETAIGGPHAYFDGVCMLLFLLLIGRYLDHRLRQRARTAARDLLALQATTASRVAPNGALLSVAARDLRPGDVIVIAAGERAATDCTILEGASDVDLSMLTGETAPQFMAAGADIPSGALNLTGVLRAQVRNAAADSTVAELARLIEAGEQGRAAWVRIADRAAALYVPIVHTLAALTFLGWMVLPEALALGHGDARHALLAAVAVLIITCPCALGLAVPAVQVVATGRLFRAGALVKSGDALERLAAADIVVMDKTGTLTLGKPELSSKPDPAVLAPAACLARGSRHPMARALAAAAGPGPAAQQIREVPGDGVEGEVAGRKARLGRAAFVTGESAAPHAADDDGAMELWFAFEGGGASRFTFTDALRPNAAEVIAGLRRRGMEVELLSGDRSEAARRAAQDAGILRWRGDLRPEQKHARLEELRQEGRRVFMIGDGLNDAPSLAAAHVSATPGSALEAAQAAADIVITGASLKPVLEAIDVARQAQTRVKENLGFSILYNFIAAPLAMAGLVTPLIAAAAMSGSSLIVTLNALRLEERRPWTR